MGKDSEAPSVALLLNAGVLLPDSDLLSPGRHEANGRMCVTISS